MKVLVPVDGSQHSELAVEAVMKAPWLSPSRILLLNVVQPIESLLPFQVESNLILKEQEIIAKKSEWLMKPAQDLKDNYPSCHVDYRVKFGAPKQIIVNTVAREKFDIVVMGSHGRSGVERLILGSCSQTVLELAPSAVLIVKNDQSYIDYSRVLIPYDGSIYSRDVISWIAQQNWRSGTKFHIVMAIADFERVTQLDMTDEQAELIKEQWHHIKERAFEILEDVALELGSHVGNEHVSIDAEPGAPRDVIYEAYEKFGANLIALGSHGRTGLKKVLIGSVSLHIAQHAPCPVLVIRRITSTELPFEDEEAFEDDSPYETEMKSGLDERPPFTMM